MPQALLFGAALLGLFALVPLAVWFATGSRVQAVRALRGYGMLMVWLVVIGAVGAVAGAIAAVML